MAGISSRSRDSVLAMVGGVSLNSLGILLAARFLGPAGRGEMVALTLIPTFGQVILGAGLGPASVFTVARDPGVASRAVGNGLIWSMGTGLLLAASGLVAGEPIASTLGTSVRGLIVALAACVAVIMYQLLSGVAQGLGDFRLVKRLRLRHGALMLGFMLLAGVVLQSRDPVLYLVGWGLAYLLAALWALWAISHQVGRPRVDVRMLGSSLRYGLGAQLSQVWELANTRADQVLIAMISDHATLGLYGTGVAVIEVLFHVPTALGQVVFWSSAQSGGDARKESAEHAGTVLALTTLSGVGLVGLTWLLAPLVFGSGYEAVPVVVSLLVVPVGVLAAARLLGSCEMGRGNPGVSAAGAAVSFFTTVAADLLLVPSWGAAGAALGCGIGYVAGSAVILILFSRGLRGQARGWLITGIRRAPVYLRPPAGGAQ